MMKKKPSKPPKVKPKLDQAAIVKRRKISRILNVIIIAQVVVLLWLVGGYLWRVHRDSIKKLPVISQVTKNENKPSGGKIVSTQQPTTYDKTQTEAIIRQTDKTFDLPIQYGVTKQVFSYTSTDARTGEQVVVYGRAYVPTNTNPNVNLPVFAFAPGTTGIADQCAASIEEPTKRNWANYDSLLFSYVSQGYVVVTTDYEGMRDTNRMHHYMIGEQEGRVLLDAVRATTNLSLTQEVVNTKKIALAGYSQGGHAAYWADKIHESYAKELDIKAVVGFGPVSSVTETLVDTASGANINWFGPYVLTSYADYYNKSYPVNSILTPRFSTNMKAEVLNSCIDTVLKTWGPKYTDVYSADFIAAEKIGISSSQFADLAHDLEKNSLTAIPTDSSKLINQGQLDNVILPAQSTKFAKNLCSKTKQTTLKVYKSATHYTTMVQSFKDTIGWLDEAFMGPVTGNCS